MRRLLIAVGLLAMAASAGPARAANLGGSPRVACRITRAPSKPGKPPITELTAGKCPCFDQQGAARNRCLKARGIIKEEESGPSRGTGMSDGWSENRRH